MTTKQIIQKIERQFPKSRAEKWDNIGLIFGNKTCKIQKIIVVLDLTTKVLDFAIKNQVNLIITHHPFLFYETTEEEYVQAPYKKNLVRKIQNTNIGVYTIHTNFDCASQGMANIVITKLGFKKCKAIPSTKYGKMISTSLSFQELTKLFQTKLGLNVIQHNTKEKDLYTQIAIFPGSASIEDIIIAKKAGVELVVTSDIKWADWITAKEMGIKLIQIPHVVEDVFTNYIQEFLQSKTKGITILSSASEEMSKL